jgi:O-antigen ligase
VSVALPLPVREDASARAERTSLLDLLLLVTAATITFARIRWTVGTADFTIADLTAGLFVAAFLASRMSRRDARLPRTVGVIMVFFALFTVVYLAGFFNLETTADRTQFAKGVVKFAVHFAFLAAAVAHLARRSEAFYWRALAWFVGGLAVNSAYGLLELAVAKGSGGNLDQLVLSPIGSYQGKGINRFGVIEGEEVYRTNALTGDPNHLGVMLAMPILILLPIYLSLDRRHRLRTPLALLLAFFGVAELATLSRSGLLAVAVGLLVLAPRYGRLFLSARFLLPLALLALVVGAVVARRPSFFETILRSRTSLSGSGTRLHLELYDLLAPSLDAHPFFGRGLNTFANYYEFITGRSNFGPHSFYLAVLTETGFVGAGVFLLFLGYLAFRLKLLHRLGTALADARDASASAVGPLAWGLTAALVGTLAGNAFYLTMHKYYFYVFAVFVAAAPVVFSRRWLPEGSRPSR